MRYQFIDQHREQFSISLMCEVLEVSRSGYYAWQQRPVSQREMENQKLLERIKQIHQECYQSYGSPRMHQALNQEGYTCGRHRVARLMHKHGIQAKIKTKKLVTTKRDPGHPVAENVLAQDFTADAPDRKWVCDITYIPTCEGWLYLACVMDLFSRRIIGYHMDTTLQASLVMQALEKACAERKPGPGLIHHSDQGSQYTCELYQEVLSCYDVVVSMSDVGNCYDNAVMESFFGTLKGEFTYDHRAMGHAEVRLGVFEYIEGFYNRRRLHSTLGYVSPQAYERAHGNRLN